MFGIFPSPWHTFFSFFFTLNWSSRFSSLVPMNSWILPFTTILTFNDINNSFANIHGHPNITSSTFLFQFILFFTYSLTHSMLFHGCSLLDNLHLVFDLLHNHHANQLAENLHMISPHFIFYFTFSSANAWPGWNRSNEPTIKTTFLSN